MDWARLKMNLDLKKSQLEEVLERARLKVDLEKSHQFQFPKISILV